METKSTIRDVLHNPAFADFGKLILPWDNRSYDEDMPLSEIGSLLPYDTHVEPTDVVNALKRLIDDAGSGAIILCF